MTKRPDKSPTGQNTAGQNAAEQRPGGQSPVEQTGPTGAEPGGEQHRDLGTFIRDLRSNARISLRQLAKQAGVSNPYLSQIERGLRKPSAEVLAQLASALRVSTPVMYLRAGLLDDKEGHGVLAAIAGDPDLTMAQKQSLTQIYETFRRENARTAAESHGGTPEPDTDPGAGRGGRATAPDRGTVGDE